MSPIKVAVVVGSTRHESINRKLAGALTRLGAGRFDFRIVEIDRLPLYNQDLETDLPAEVSRFKAEIEAADALLFVTPEHNRSIPAALKNAIDWGARPWGSVSWAGKPAAITGTSPGAISTALAQQHLRQILGILGVHVMGGEAYIADKPGMVGADGAIADASVRSFLKSYLDQFAAFASRFAMASRAAA